MQKEAPAVWSYMQDDRSSTIETLMLGMVEGELQQGQPRQPVQRWMDDILMWCS